MSSTSAEKRQDAPKSGRDPFLFLLTPLKKTPTHGSHTPSRPLALWRGSEELACVLGVGGCSTPRVCLYGSSSKETGGVEPRVALNESRILHFLQHCRKSLSSVCGMGGQLSYIDRLCRSFKILLRFLDTPLHSLPYHSSLRITEFRHRKPLTNPHIRNVSPKHCIEIWLSSSDCTSSC
jgi:hypothetical protein